MTQTIKKVIQGLTGIVIREGDRFKLGEEVRGIPPLHPKHSDYLQLKLQRLPEITGRNLDRIIDIVHEYGLTVKALVKVSDLSITASDPTNVVYKDADEDVSLNTEDSAKYAGYRLVLWGDLRSVSEGLISSFPEGIKPPVIRYLKPEK